MRSVPRTGTSGARSQIGPTGDGALGHGTLGDLLRSAAPPPPGKFEKGTMCGNGAEIIMPSEQDREVLQGDPNR